MVRLWAQGKLAGLVQLCGHQRRITLTEPVHVIPMQQHTSRATWLRDIMAMPRVTAACALGSTPLTVMLESVKAAQLWSNVIQDSARSFSTPSDR